MDTQYTRPVSAGIRLVSMFLDHLFMTVVAVAFAVPGLLSNLVNSFSIDHDQPDTNVLGGAAFYFMLLGVSVYLCKDCIQGRSLAKRMIGLKVINHKTGDVANPLRCFVRNLFIVIWPLEVIVTLFSPRRRLGDRVAGTRVVYYLKNNQASPRINPLQVAGSLGMAYLVLLLMLLPFRKMQHTLPESDVIKSSYNAAESKNLEVLYNRYLGNYQTASVRVHDSVRGLRTKHVSIIYRLREDYLNDDPTFMRIHGTTLDVLDSVYSDAVYTGQVRYVFQTSSNIHTKTAELTKGRP